MTSSQDHWFERDEANQLATGDSHPTFLCLFTAGVKDLVETGDIVVGKIHRNLGHLVFINIPAHTLDVLESSGNFDRRAIGIADDRARGIAFGPPLLAQI